jgi:hypothetical protein
MVVEYNHARKVAHVDTWVEVPPALEDESDWDMASGVSFARLVKGVRSGKGGHPIASVVVDLADVGEDLVDYGKVWCSMQKQQEAQAQLDSAAVV